MEINNNTIINVYSYEPHQIIATSNVQDYTFEPCENRNAPIVIPMSSVEIKNIHSKSHIFSDGYLTFGDDEKEDVYEYLKIANWQDILTQEDIIDTILHCTKDKLQKIIDISSISYFERVRGVYIALKQQKADISLRVADVIEARYKELLKNKFKTSIELRDNNFTDVKNDGEESEKIAVLEKQIEEKDIALKELAEKIAKFEEMFVKSANVENKETVSDKPKRGRPSAK